MRECKKWVNKHVARPITPAVFAALELGWEAALWRLYKELGHSEDDKRIKDWIEKELEKT